MTPGAPRAALPGWPIFDDEQIEAVVAVLRSGRTNYWTGQQCRVFERAFAGYCGAAHALSTASGTRALEMSLVGLGIGPGDEVIVPARSFIATASAVVLCGAVPVFADVEHDSQNLTAASAAAVLTPRTRAIIAVHLSGWPCEMDSLCDLASERGLYVVEDCAQAHGATVAGRRVGGIGHAAAFSFCEDKIMSTGGEGGMMMCRDEAVFERAWSYREHGKRIEALTPAAGPGYRWLHDSVGTNARMTEVQAAIGNVQLRRLDDWIAARQSNADRVAAKLADIAALRVARPPPHLGHAGYRLAMTIDARQLRGGWTRDRIVGALQRAGVPCSAGVCPELYRETALAPYAPRQRLPVAAQLADTHLDLRLPPTLSNEDLEFIAAQCARVCDQALR